MRATLAIITLTTTTISVFSVRILIKFKLISFSFSASTINKYWPKFIARGALKTLSNMELKTFNAFRIKLHLRCLSLLVIFGTFSKESASATWNLTNLRKTIATFWRIKKGILHILAIYYLSPAPNKFQFHVKYLGEISFSYSYESNIYYIHLLYDIIYYYSISSRAWKLSPIQMVFKGVMSQF